MNKIKALILGVNGMVGHKLFLELSKDPSLEVYGTTRKTSESNKKFLNQLDHKITSGIDANNFQTIVDLLEKLRPEWVINCIGITKQLVDDNNPLQAIEINSAMPHKLAKACNNIGSRMIQMATDCVFNGEKGNYKESDPSDATDVYGRTKFLGEVYYPHCLTIRTSFIGHEIGEQKHGLLEWFLSQKKETKGFTKAIYSGMPTVEIARVISKYILPNKDLHGLYQVSAEPINKYDLLKLIAKIYDKKITIFPNDSVSIDRSLNSDHFRTATGYKPLSWEEMVNKMYLDYKSSY